MISRDRIISIDLLRGVALAGILIMNIQSFSMPTAAYMNPTAYGELTGLNKWVWIISHMVASEKFMSIFSMLFGAGILIFIQNATARGKNTAALHFRRMVWLLLFGMLHAYLLWPGDILVCYALCGMVGWFFRDMKTTVLLRVGLVFFLIPMVLGTMWALTMPYWPAEAVASIKETWNPEAESILLELETMRGGWLDQMKFRVSHAIEMQTMVFFVESLWRVIAMMLLGMFLLKREILTAGRSRKFYIHMTLFGLVSGYLLSAIGLEMNFQKGWTLEYSMFLGGQFNYLGSVAVALGYTGLVMLISQSGHFKKGVKAISGLGRTAFSNYIFQTLVCTLIFYGHGLGLFGSLERKFQLLVVVGVWIVQLILTSLWLRKFRRGPLEALWRSLTYRKRFLIRKPSPE